MKTVLLRLALAAAALAAGSCRPAVRPEQSPPAAAKPAFGGPAPAWSLKDVDGLVVNSDRFKGKVVVLDFWATWCGPCKQEVPGYVSLQRKYAEAGLVVVGVSMDQGGPALVRKFIERNGVGYPVVMGDEGIAAAFGGIDRYPTTFIIDRDGTIRSRKTGAMKTADFERLLLPYLKPPGGSG